MIDDIIHRKDANSLRPVAHSDGNQSPGAPPVAHLERSKILIVDDEPGNRKLLADFVEREGYRALVAAGGAEALEMVVREPVDVVLLDVMMPDMDGITVLSHLQERGIVPGLPVLVITANEDRSVKLDALGAGAIDFVARPLDHLEVACRLRTLSDLKRLKDAALRQAQHALRESRHRLRLQFEQSPVARIDWDLDFRVAAWNQAAERLFGYTSSEAIGRHAALLIAGSTDSRLGDIWRELMTTGSNRLTSNGCTQQGNTVICEWHNALLKTADGTVIGATSAVLDITERIRLHEALVQSQKLEAVGKLAGGVAHDFNNVLEVILSHAGFLLSDLPEDDERRADVIEVLHAAKRAAALTRQLLTFARRRPTQQKPTDLNQNLNQIRKLVTKSIGEQIDVELRPESAPAVVEIDPVQFDQILLNLALNARDAMPGGGRLTIALRNVPASRSQPARVLLTVSDTGHGMDSQTAQRVFEPFFTTKEQGTGLGLATCFRIVQQASGEIRVRSAPNRGTTFTVEFPVCAGEPEVCGRERCRTLSGHGERVLVVEDEPALRRVMIRVLENAGYRVHSAVDGTDAVRQIDLMRSEFDLILSDVVMPGCDGYAVAAHAARVAPGSVVLLTSGYVDGNHRPSETQLPILWKPLGPEALTRAVAEALATSNRNTPLSAPRLKSAKTAVYGHGSTDPRFQQVSEPASAHAPPGEFGSPRAGRASR